MNEKRHSSSRSAAPAPDQTGRERRDTIVALATTIGRSAVSVVRLSGADAIHIAQRCVTPWPSRDRELTRCRVHAPDHPEQAIDDALVAVFPGPKSYTGETVIEIQGHGGTYVPVAIEAALVAAGARPALPGEFTERATLNGKLDLVRAEAIGAVIDARTRASHRAAMHALSGLLTHRYVTLRSDAIGIEALIAYDIDFPEEDHGPVARDRVSESANALAQQIHALVETQPAAILARDGAVVVLAGPPNAGKSSLLNALVGEARMIVSDEPGTTRDAVEVLLDLDPWPIRLVDTAGLRAPAGPVERLGIEVSERYLQAADAIVVCAETETALAEIERRIGALSSAPIIRVLTKSDLQGGTPGQAGDAHRVSTVTGDGLIELQLCIAKIIAERVGHPADLPPLVASARQRQALELAEHELDLFRAAWSEGALPAPVAATHLRAAIGALDELIGAIDVDEVFSRVFATFCVGK